MEKIKFGGFPPLILEDRKDIKKGELKPQYFSEKITKKNINIRELINKERNDVINTSEESFEELESV